MTYPPAWITIVPKPTTAAAPVAVLKPAMLRADYSQIVELKEGAGGWVVWSMDGSRAEMWLLIGTADARRFNLVAVPGQ